MLLTDGWLLKATREFTLMVGGLDVDFPRSLYKNMRVPNSWSQTINKKIPNRPKPACAWLSYRNIHRSIEISQIGSHEHSRGTDKNKYPEQQRLGEASCDRNSYFL